MSQSPSLRGSGRFKQSPETSVFGLPCLNPLHCGAVVASHDVAGGPRPIQSGLNPLHCGAVVASLVNALRRALPALFQSPSLRGSGRFPAKVR